MKRKTIKAIIKSARNNKNLCYGSSAKGFFLDAPKERHIKLFTHKDGKITKCIAKVCI